MAAEAELQQILLRAFPDCRIESCEALAGGISCRAVVAQLLLQNDTTVRVVVRRPQYRAPEEMLRVASSEYRLLSRCAAFGIPAPKPCFLDTAARALVLEYVEGAPEFAPRDTPDLLRQMATQLVRIHEVGVDGLLEFLQHRNQSAGLNIQHTPARLDASLDERSLRSVLSQLWPWPQHNPDALLHGDYWPGNLLWQNGKLVAVLDWEETEVGDPLADIAIARLDLLWAFGEDAMHNRKARQCLVSGAPVARTKL